MQSYIEVDEEDLYILKINCKGKRTIGKASNGINVEKYIIGLKKLKHKIIKKRKEKNGRRTKKGRKKKEEDSTELQKPNVDTEGITAMKIVTEKIYIYTHP